jgi:hypothetical protein
MLTRKKEKRAAEKAKRNEITTGLKAERVKRKHSEVTKNFRLTSLDPIEGMLFRVVNILNILEAVNNL